MAAAPVGGGSSLSCRRCDGPLAAPTGEIGDSLLLKGAAWLPATAAASPGFAGRLCRLSCESASERSP